MFFLQRVFAMQVNCLAVLHQNEFPSQACKPIACRRTVTKPPLDWTNFGLSVSEKVRRVLAVYCATFHNFG